MRERFERLIRWVFDFLPMRQVVRYCISGTISTIADFGVTVLLKECLGVIPRIAAVCGFLVSIMISYTFATLWIFDEHRFDKRVFEVLGYLFVTIVGAGLTWNIMFLGVNVIGIHYIIVKVFAVGVVTIWNFCAKKVLVFTRKK